jgi:hypothetical protein
VKPFREDVAHDLEPNLVQQISIFRSIEACVVERITAKIANRLAKLWTGIEHQDRTRGSMRSKHVEHLPLIAMVEMKKAVPGEDTLE